VTPFAHLFIRIADRLTKVAAGSIEADRTIHAALGLTGPVQPYTREEAAARSLLPAGLEWVPPHYSGPVVYAACRAAGRMGSGGTRTMANGDRRCRWRCAAQSCGRMRGW
jgi:hypothetical protein